MKPRSHVHNQWCNTPVAETTEARYADIRDSGINLILSSTNGFNGPAENAKMLALCEKFPELDPTHIRYTDMHKWITELEDFRDDPAKSTEGKLEAIQMAWLEEYQESR